jgi:hypothetical protein
MESCNDNRQAGRRAGDCKIQAYVGVSMDAAPWAVDFAPIARRALHTTPRSARPSPPAAAVHSLVVLEISGPWPMTGRGEAPSESLTDQMTLTQARVVGKASLKLDPGSAFRDGRVGIPAARLIGRPGLSLLFWSQRLDESWRESLWPVLRQPDTCRRVGSARHTAHFLPPDTALPGSGRNLES